MEVTSAIALVNALAYKPGWTLEAVDHTRRFEGAICLRVTYPARNSDRDQAAAGYPREITARAAFPILVGDLADDDALYRRVIERLVEIETHEAREFLRVRGTWWAPFHPHRIDGMRRWARTAGADAEVVPDLQFGLS